MISQVFSVGKPQKSSSQEELKPIRILVNKKTRTLMIVFPTKLLRKLRQKPLLSRMTQLKEPPEEQKPIQWLEALLQYQIILPSLRPLNEQVGSTTQYEQWTDTTLKDRASQPINQLIGIPLRGRLEIRQWGLIMKSWNLFLRKTWVTNESLDQSLRVNKQRKLLSIRLTNSLKRKWTVSYTHLTLPTIYSV